MRSSNNPPVSSADWASATSRVVSFAAFFAAAAVAAGVLAGALADLASATDDADPAARAGMAIGSMIISLLALGSMLGLLISWLFWSRSAKQMSGTYGVPQYGHLGYWGGGLFAALLAASYLAPARLNDTSTALTVQASLRVIGVAVLIGGVLHTRNWFRGRTDPTGQPYAADRYSLTTGGDPASPLAATPTPADWDASVWDPAVQREIERRRARDEQ